MLLAQNSNQGQVVTDVGSHFTFQGQPLAALPQPLSGGLNVPDPLGFPTPSGVHPVLPYQSASTSFGLTSSGFAIPVSAGVSAPAVASGQASLSLIGGGATLAVAATRSAGDDSSATASDNSAPVFTAGTSASASVAENTSTVVYNANATDNGGATDAGITYSLLGTDKDLFSINATTGEVKFKTNPDYENPTDSGRNNIYDITVRAMDASKNYADQAIALSVTNRVDAGDSVIDLGEYGLLMAPVCVDNKWYYAWDMNGDGTHNNTQDTTGKYGSDGSEANASGSGYQYDYATHDVLDGIFTQDVNGNTGGGSNTDNTYRFAEINGIKLALPTIGSAWELSENTIEAYYRPPGGGIDNNPVGETNLTFDDLLAIWDAYNCSGSRNLVDGTPPGWWYDSTDSVGYWSATPMGNDRHAVFRFDNGSAHNTGDALPYYVAIQVFSNTAGPVFTAGASASVNVAENTATALCYTPVVTDNMGITGYALAGGADEGKFTLDAKTGALTFKAAPDYETPGSAAGNNTYTVNIQASDAAGDSAVQTVMVTVTDVADEQLPVFSSPGNASVEENTATTTVVYNANATDNGGATDAGITYSLLGTDEGRFSINASTGEVTFKTSPDYERPTDNGGDNVYDFTVRATDASNNYADQAVALTLTDAPTSYTLGQSVIDLDEYGLLIAPVFVDGNWYYVWDMNGDGVHDGTKDLMGKWDDGGAVANASGSGYQYDYATHDVLDGIFTQDANGTTGDGGNTDNTYRFATLNGIKLALPTFGDGRTYVDSLGDQAGTAIDNSPAGETNPTYDDLLSVWDGFNGSGTGTGASGTPPGWQAYGYWSATPSTNGHAALSLYCGDVYDGDDDGNAYVALQVL